MIRKAGSYIKFLWQSKNAHGVHSPFVFELVTQCFYNKGYEKDFASRIKSLPGNYPGEQALLLYKLALYFKPQSVATTGNISWQHYIINFALPCVIFNESNLHGDFIYIAENNYETIIENIECIIRTKEPTGIVIIENIHYNSAMVHAWQYIKAHPEVTVTIDTFYFGIITFRQQQARQHFIIRASVSGITDAVLGIRTLWGLLD